MCGIAGYWVRRGLPNAELLADMTNLLVPRGPDGVGYWLGQTGVDGQCFAGLDSPPSVRAAQPLLPQGSKPHALGFGHRRYAVLAQGAQGHQPMCRGDLVLVYNGELYNYHTLRTELTQCGVALKTGSDTEVVLAAYEQWGIECLNRFRGFFAFALHDGRDNTLLLARDPLGKAPLYVAQKTDVLYFASEIKPLLRACPEMRAQVDPLAVSHYLCAGLRDVGHQTFWRNIQSLPNGSWLRVQLNTGHFETKQYWHLPTRRLEEAALPFETALSQFKALLRQSVERRLVSDVPIGFTLSGGLDSSAVVAMYAQAPRPGKVPVFTIRYQDPRHDESPYARAVVARYAHCLEHHVLDGEAHTLAEAWDGFLRAQEEPFHDPVLFTDYWQLQRLKALGVGVYLSGSAADELLAGYPAHLLAHLRGLSPENPAHWADGVGDVAALWRHTDLALLQSWLKRRWQSPNKASWRPFLRFDPALVAPPARDFDALLLEKMGDSTMHYWLRSLQKHAMQIPIEPRLPFLDQDLVEFCLKLPRGYLIKRGWTKYILRRAVVPLLPPEVVWRRRKMGFPFDTAAWLARHADMHRSMFQAAADNPWVDGSAVARQYENLLRTDAQLLWRLLCFCQWWRVNLPTDTPRL